MYKNYRGLIMRKVLITGAAGFVGRYFTKHFLDAGDEVWCIDNVAPLTGGKLPKEWPLFDPREYKNFKFLHEDCRDFFKKNKNTDFDLALHLAAMVGGRLMIENNPLVVAEDLAIDAGYWSWAKEVKPKKTITFSSSAAYPIHLQRKEEYVLLKEDMMDFKDTLGMPDMTYGWAKLTTEYVGRVAYEKYGLKSVAYRPFSGYGEDQDKAYPFPSICKRALDNIGSTDFMVWGTGDQMRDFIHISDCVRGVITTMDKIDNGEAINLSTGTLISFKQFAKIACNLCGYDPVIVGSTDKPSGVFARGGDKAKQVKLGFEYEIDFKEGVKQGLESLS
jgi:nucleoside-diphosphate-sugar epimerase